MPQWHIPNLDETQTVRLAELVALKLQAGDVLRLNGDLGAGKTTVARAIIRAVAANHTLDVPSPTYALLQTYDLQRLNLAHLDLYRLKDQDEIEELGLEELIKTHAVLVEWPDKLPEDLSASVLTLTFDDTADHSRRTLNLEGQGRWSTDLERINEISTFLSAGNALPGHHLQHMQGDASTRSYVRLAGTGRSEILMDSARQADGPAVHDEKPYSQLAHLAEDVRAFVAVGCALRNADIAAPEIYDADLNRGLLRLEDFGDVTFSAAMEAGVKQSELWRAATDVLLKLQLEPPPQHIALPDSTDYCLSHFSPDVMSVEAGLFPQWYWPHATDATVSDTAKQAYEETWHPHFNRVSQHSNSWLLRDYHSPNLMWLTARSGHHKVGVIDFQDALIGPGEYDLVSLLQDARIDVPDALEVELMRHYCDQVSKRSPAFSEVDFAYRYAVLGAQRASKILGIFARLANRDGKRAYLSHVPRIWRYLERNLRHPDLSDLRAWFDEHFAPEHRRSTRAGT